MSAIQDELYRIVERRSEWLQFAARRLARQLAHEERAVQAYFVLARANHPDAPRLLDRALFEASRSGDWKAIMELSTVGLARAIERVDNEEIIHSHFRTWRSRKRLRCPAGPARRSRIWRRRGVSIR